MGTNTVLDIKVLAIYVKFILETVEISLNVSSNLTKSHYKEPLSELNSLNKRRLLS